MEQNTIAPVQGTVPLSTSLDSTPSNGPAGAGGRISDTKEQGKPESIGDTLRGELAKVRETETKEPADEKKPEADAKDDKAKPEKDEPAKGDEKHKEKARSDDGKFAKKDEEPAKADKGAVEKPAAERSAPDDNRQSEGRKFAEPPARFLPEARTKWANVPSEIKAEFHRISEEMEREGNDNRQYREDLREYEDLAKQYKVTVKDTMARYVAADRALAQNFGAGIAQLVQQYGHQPVQAIAAIIQAHGITPQQYAEHVMKNPQAHVAPAPRQQPTQAPQPNAEIQALRAELEAMRAETIVGPIIREFASAHPDYKTLEPQIDAVLRSGVIENIYGTGLSPEQKLAEAYRMAGGRAPSRSEPEPAPVNSGGQNRPVDLDGQKSVRGAPNGGQEPDDDDPATDLKALLRKEMRRAV